MKKQLIAMAGLILLGLVACKNEGNNSKMGLSAKKDYSNVQVDTDSESEKFSYGIGMIIGASLKNSGVDSVDYQLIDRAFTDTDNDQLLYSLTTREVQRMRDEQVPMDKINQDIIKRALYDVLEADTSLINIQEVGQSYQTYMQNNFTRIAEENLNKGKEFLEQNKNKEGVKVTDSGLQYEIIQEGTDGAVGSNDLVKVWYSAKTLGGDEFKEDTAESYTFVDLKDGFSEIPSLTEAVALAPLGTEMNLYIPSNLAFGENRMSREIGPNSTLIVHVSKTEKADAETAKEHRKEKAAWMKEMQQQQRR